MSLFKKNRSYGESNSASAEKPKLVWGSVLPGRLYEKWPKTGGEPEPPAFLVHRSSLNLEDEMLVQMLEAYDIPAIRQYPANGSFGKVVIGMSGEGTDIYVPASLLADALLLIGGPENDKLHE